MARLYERYTLGEMAKLLRCNTDTVRAYLKEAGVGMRRTGEAPPLRDDRDSIEIKPPDKDALARRDRITLSWWRLHVLAGLCPANCPDAACSGHVVEDEDCELFRAVRKSGELARRPWEPQNHAGYYKRRLGSNGGQKRAAHDGDWLNDE